MHLTQTILVFDQEILAQFAEQSSAARSQIAAFCERHALRCYVLYHDEPQRLCEGLTEHGGIRRLLLKPNESCSCAQAVCVRDGLLTVSDPDDQIFLVMKDERSICLASYSDRIFAAGQSLKLCSEISLPHHPVVRWSDCERLIQPALSSRSGNIRRQARLHRMDAIKTE